MNRKQTTAITSLSLRKNLHTTDETAGKTKYISNTNYMQIFSLHPFFVNHVLGNSLFNFIVSFAVFAADEMLLLLRLQLFASVLVSVAYGAVWDGAEQFYRVVIHEPVAKHGYLYHFETCSYEFPVYSDGCWIAGDKDFDTFKKVKDYYIT